MAEQLLNGRYRLLRPLGTGGMASVYLAEDLRLGRRVAVKILHPQFAADPAFVARFEQEARMAAAVSHPNLVQVYDVGHDGDRRYIVMEFVEGETLKDLITRQGALPVARALEIAGGVLAALEIAHAHNLIHRDVKAQNILLPAGGGVKVTDFGIARELGGTAAATLTATGTIIGTVHYFSPEQAQGRPATAQSDLYATGVVLYEMLTGRLPFDAENPLAVAMQQINQAPPLPTAINSAIPASVEAIVLKAMAKNPAGRYASAAEMRAAVEAAQASAGQPTARAPRTPPPAQIRPAASPGATRVATRQGAAASPPSGNVRRKGVPWLWLLTLAAIAAVAAMLGVAVYGNTDFHPFGIGSAAPTPTFTATATPTPTNTPRPTATRPVIVVPPTATHTPRPTPTHTPRPTPTRTPRPTATATTRPTATPTDTAAPTATATDTLLPSPTPSDTPSPTVTPAPPTDTPTTVPPTDTPSPTAAPPTATSTTGPPGVGTVAVTPTVPTASPVATAAGAAIVLSPSTTVAGGSLVVTGSGWPDGEVVSLSADFGNGPVKLGAPPAAGGTFSTPITVPPDVPPGTYQLVARDPAGDSVVQDLTVSG